MPWVVADHGADGPADLARTIETALDRLTPPGRLAVAVSGGGDSMALLAIAARWADARNRELLAVTVDHGLRIESAAEAEFVADFAARIGVAQRTLKAVGRAPGHAASPAPDCS